jgi:hypothetical protein
MDSSSVVDKWGGTRGSESPTRGSECAV